MANSIRTVVTRTTYDSNGSQIDPPVTYLIAASYTSEAPGSFVAQSADKWITVELSHVHRTSYVEFNADQPVTLKWTSSGTAFTQSNVTNLIICGEIAQFYFKNVSGSDANVSWKIYGERVADYL